MYLWTLSFFFFNDTATTEIYTLSLHDALPISCAPHCSRHARRVRLLQRRPRRHQGNQGGHGRRRIQIALRPPHHCLRRRSSPLQQSSAGDRKSTRLNSSHGYISYAVFCLKKKTIKHRRARPALRVGRQIERTIPVP